MHRYLTMGTVDFIDISGDDDKTDNLNATMHISDSCNSLTEMMEEFEKRVITQQFEKHNWHQSKTAKALQIDRKTLYRKVKQHNITRFE